MLSCPSSFDSYVLVLPLTAFTRVRRLQRVPVVTTIRLKRETKAKTSRVKRCLATSIESTPFLFPFFKIRQEWSDLKRLAIRDAFTSNTIIRSGDHSPHLIANAINMKHIFSN